ncbi:hypothetical protein CgunFtcFv8_015891 [Champsocephalus gunnari]|uniref:Uncharacterized protein n=1 Tax=Champsocephalus gunnari TaxID=52237 RepID=A0AAN8H1J1_CHAGU|nr:hypothetical protein CgunFtcFv8_015891 [Champsocephalus gunnari]
MLHLVLLCVEEEQSVSRSPTPLFHRRERDMLASEDPVREDRTYPLVRAEVSYSRRFSISNREVYVSVGR